MYIRFIFLCFFLVISVCILRAQSKSDLEKHRNAILRDIEETQNILETTKQSKSESLEKLDILNKMISLRNSEIDNLMLEIDSADKRIRELEKNTDAMSGDIDAIKKEYAHMILLAYLNRNKYNQMMFLLSSRDFNQAYKRLLYLRQYSENRKRQVDLIEGMQKELAVQRIILEQEKEGKLKLAERNKEESLKLQNEVSEKERTVNKLKAREKDLVKRLNNKNRIAQRLQLEIENIVKAEINRRNRTSAKDRNTALNVNEDVLGSSFNDNKGKLPWPLENGIITSGFGEHPHPVYKGVVLRNNGIDISTREGSEVKSIFSGEVKAVIYILGSNYTVIIRHGNFLSVYQNLVDIKVKNGDKVSTKQVLGKVFTDENSKSTVLHVEIWDELKKLNPEIWLTRRGI